MLRVIFTYILLTITLLFALFTYIFYTNSGQKVLYSVLNYVASKKAGFEVEIRDIHIRNYPYIRANIIAEEEYLVYIEGFVKPSNIDLKYTLQSSCVKSNICRFDDIINIEGKAIGSRNNLLVSGAGTALDGNITYSFRRIPKSFRNVSLQLNDMNSSKLFKLFDQKPLFEGKSNANIHFDKIEKLHKKGTINYSVNDKNFYSLDVQLDTHINIENNNHTFTIDLISPKGELHIKNGIYNQEKKLGHANYDLNISDLSHFKTLIQANLMGVFNTSGDIYYDKLLKITGTSDTLDGNLSLEYTPENTQVNFYDISLKKLSKVLKVRHFVNGIATGNASYRKQTKHFTLTGKLLDTTILPSHFSKQMNNNLDINLSNEVFNRSDINISYQNHILQSNIKIANDKMHLILTDTVYRKDTNEIETNIDFSIANHTIKGKLFSRINQNNVLNNLYIMFDGRVEKYYKIHLDGVINQDFLNMVYALSSKRLSSHVCTIVDDVNLTGFVNGSWDNLQVRGKGTIMEGDISYHANKIKDSYEDVSIKLKGIHALKLSTLFGQPEMPSGKADVEIEMPYINKNGKKGEISYLLKDGEYSELPLSLNADATIQNQSILFDVRANLSGADIVISDGTYNLKENSAAAHYSLDVKNLLSLKPLIGKYFGPFYARGEISYKDILEIRGLTNTYEGMLDFLYRDNFLIVNLKQVSLSRFTKLFTNPPILEAKINGNINYDFKKEKLIAKANLHNTKFLDSDFVQTVYKKSGVNMLIERFPLSKLTARYENNILLGDIVLDNGKSHFYLRNTKIDYSNNTVDAYFDLKLQGQEFSGKVYGTTKKPKINLDMQKLLRYQMDKQLDSVIGKGNRKLMESMPMGDVAKDMASDIGAGFMGMFF